MPDNWYRLPDGTGVNIPDDTTPAQLGNLFDQLSERFPDSIGEAWSLYGQGRPEEEEEDGGNIFGRAYQTLENIPRGAAAYLPEAAYGIAALLSPDKDTATEKKLRKAKDWLYSGIDPKYEDDTLPQIGLALGQMIPQMLGGVGLAKLGVGAAVPGALMKSSLGRKVVEAAGGARNVQNVAAGSLLSVPSHWGQYAQGISNYEQRTGEDVSALKELVGFAPSTLLGIGEMLPVSKIIPGAGTVARESAELIGAGLAKKGLLSNLTAFGTGAAAEGVQEIASELGQMSIARALYDDEALEDMGSKLWDAGIIGGGAGGVLSVLTNLAIRGGRRNAMGIDVASENALRQEHNLSGSGDPDFSRARATEGGVSAADQETLDANRRERLKDDLLNEETDRQQAVQEARESDANRRERLGIELSKQEGRREQVDPVVAGVEPFVALTPEEFDTEVQNRFEASKANEAAEALRAQEAQTRAREDAGATFLELDELHGRSAEEISELFRTNQITGEAYIELLIADRLGNVGRESRGELREFAKVNAEVNNRYTPALVATAVLAGHPRVDTSNNTSSELFGERAARAVGVLNEYLTPESQALLAQESLSPADINIIIDEASRTEGFDKDLTDDLIYNFTGNVGLYGRVNQFSQEQAAGWRKDETGQLEFVIPDPKEQAAIALIQKVVGQASDPQGAKGLRPKKLDIWKSHSDFEQPLLNLLKIKNIQLHSDKDTGPKGLNSDGFRALLQRVTGKTKLKNLTPGQRRALFGRIANMPTFRNPTPLPDLSRPLYSAAQVQSVLGALRMARDKTTRKGQPWVEIEDLVGPREGAAPGARLTNMLEADQLVRHLVEAGYVTAQKRKGSKGRNNLQIYLNDVTRPSTVEATDAATDPERAALEEKTVKKIKTKEQLASKFQEVKLALGANLRRFSLPGLEEVLSADLNGIWGAVEGIVENPADMANSVTMLDGPNAQLWVSLSQIDPDGKRPIKDIIQDITEEVVQAYEQGGYWYENEVRTMDSRAFDTVVPASVSEQGHKDGLNFVQFVEKLYPDLNQQDLMSEARAKYMTALVKDQLPRGRTAGKVGNLKGKIASFLTAGIESGRDAEMQAMLNIFADFMTGEVGRRGRPAPDEIRSLRLSRYADPRHIKELKKAIEDGDKGAEQRIAREILDEKKFDMAQSAPPELTWRDKLVNRFMMDEELADTSPGEIPLIGLNASDRAINEYFRQKRGEQPYTMPEPIKRRFRNEQQWAPSKELEDLVSDRISRFKAEPKLNGEIVVDRLVQLDVLAELTGDPDWDSWTTKEKFNKTATTLKRLSYAWHSDDTLLKNLKKFGRYGVADASAPIEQLGQMKDSSGDGLRSLADSSAIAMARWRDSVGNAMTSVHRMGGISWVGTPLDGTQVYQEYGPEQETLEQMFAHLQSAQDRQYGALYSSAKRFRDMTRKRLNGEAQAALDLAEETGDEANKGFFSRQTKERRWEPDKKWSIKEQVADAEATMARIALEAPHVVQFSESYQAHNKRSTLPWLLSTGEITQEMYDYLQDMTYVPLYKDVGTVKSWPLGSDGRGQGAGKSTERVLEFGRMVESKGHVFDHALEDFDNLEEIDLLRNIMNSEIAALRAGFTNTLARRVIRDTQELTEKGYGIQSRRVKKPGPNVIRVMVNGQQEFHELADPLLANAVMTMGFSSGNNFLRVFRVGAQVTRWGVVNFPLFMYNNFVRDSGSANIVNSAAKPAFFPLKDSIKKAMEGDVLQRALRAGALTGSGLYPSIQEQVGGMTAIEEFLEGESMLAKGLKSAGKGLGIEISAGKRLADDAAMQKRYEEVSADLEAGDMPLKSAIDYVAYMRVMYRNLQEVGESTARMGVLDTVLAGTGSVAEANLQSLEIMNFGRHGANPYINAITSSIPFMSGQITGTDTFIRTWNGSPDAVGATAVDPRISDEAVNVLKFRLFNRMSYMLGLNLAYYLMARNSDCYKRAGKVERMNSYLIPVGRKCFKLPTPFVAGALLKSMPESILRAINEDDYTALDVAEEAGDQVKRNLGFHLMPQLVKPMWEAVNNKNSFTRESIVPSSMEHLPSEYQKTPYTSDSAEVLADIFGTLPGVKTLSSPMKLEYMIRQYFGQAGLYAMLASDRIIREYTGKNIVGTRYDWSPSSLLTGEGIENFPIIGDVLTDSRQGRANTDKFYELKDEVDAYVSVVNKLRKEGSPEEVQKWVEDNVDTQRYSSKMRRFGRYMVKWRQRRDRLLGSDWMSDDRKRELLFDLIEERNEVLDGLTSVSAGMKGLLPQQEFVR